MIWFTFIDNETSRRNHWPKGIGSLYNRVANCRLNCLMKFPDLCSWLKYTEKYEYQSIWINLLDIRHFITDISFFQNAFQFAGKMFTVQINHIQPAFNSWNYGVWIEADLKIGWIFFLAGNKQPIKMIIEMFQETVMSLYHKHLAVIGTVFRKIFTELFKK